MSHFLVCDRSLYRVSCHKVRTSHDKRIRFLLQVRDNSSDCDFNLFCSGLTDTDVMLLSQVSLDIVGEHVTCDSDTVLNYDTAQ